MEKGKKKIVEKGKFVWSKGDEDEENENKNFNFM